MPWAWPALAMALSAVFVINGHLLTMNVFEPLIWMGCASVVIRIIQTGNQKLWLWFGVLAGIGLETKYSMAVFGLGIVVGVLLTPERKALDAKWIWLAGVVGIPDLPAELAVEHSLPLAIRAVDAQHQSRGPRRSAGTAALHAGADR